MSNPSADPNATSVNVPRVAALVALAGAVVLGAVWLTAQPTVHVLEVTVERSRVELFVDGESRLVAKPGWLIDSYVSLRAQHDATLPVTLVMIRAIRDYEARTGVKVGYKPAGGISKAKDALTYLCLIKDELGDRWLRPDLFRFGASSLLGDIERQLEHHVTGRYSAAWRHPMG